MPYCAQSDTSNKDLKSMMYDLGMTFNALSKSILKEDYDDISQFSSTIAKYNLPDKDYTEIKLILRDKVRDFKTIEADVRNAANSIVKLSKKRQLSNIVDAHAIMFKSCVKCHSLYRKSLSNHLEKR